MKKLLSFLMVLMLTALLPVAHAQWFEAVSPSGHTLSYYLDNGGAVINGHGEISGALVIPDSVTYEGVSYPVTRIDSWVFNDAAITSLVIGNNVTEVSYGAFYHCMSLASVTFPSSLTIIGGEAFRDCQALTSVVIGENVTTIGNSAFYYCTSLTSVTLPTSLTYMQNAFNECSSLTRVDYEGTIDQWLNIDFSEWGANPLMMAHHLYIGGSEVTDLVIPDGMTIIKPYVFQGCTGLESVTIPSSVDSICDDAFRDCYGMARVYCSSLSDWCNIGFANEGANPVYSSQKLYVNGSRVVNSLVIPEGVTAIKPHAFRNLHNVYSVSLPEGLQRIGRYAFWDFEWGVTYNIPSTVTSIAEYAMYGSGPIFFNAVNCTVTRTDTWVGAVALPYVNTVIIGESVQRIPRYLLPHDNNLSVLKMKSDTPPELANYALDDNTNAVIQVPCGKLLTYRAADGWRDLPNNFQENTPYTLTFGPMQNGGAGFNQEASCNAPAIISCWANGGYHFARWSDGVTDNYRTVYLTQDTVLTPIFMQDFYDTLSSGVTAMYYYNGEGLTLASVTGTINGPLVIPDSVMYEGEMLPVTVIEASFSEQHGMTSVTLPKGLTRVGWAFYDCTGLTRVDFNGTIEQWCSIAFNDWCANPIVYAHHLYFGGTEVTNLVIPEGVTAIGRIAFRSLSALNSVTFPSTLDTIGEEAFYDCNNLQRVNYNGTLADWCGIKFYDWRSNPIVNSHNLYINGSKVTSLDIPEGVTVIRQNAFHGLNDITSITLPESLLTIGNNAFNDVWVNGGVTIPSSVTYIGEWAIRGNIVYYDATNCDYLANDAFPDVNTIVVGENVQSLPTNFFVDRINILKMLGNPPVVAQYALERLRSDAQVKVPCGMLSAYHAADYWSNVPNLSETPMFDIRFGEAEHGNANVSREATCTMPAQVTANANEYYHFVHWTDGNINNPRSITLTQDTLLTPVFAIDTYTVAVYVYGDDSLRGTVSGGGMVRALDSVTIVAHANPGYRFSRWDDWDEGWGDSVRTLPSYGDRNYFAQFDALNFCDTLSNGVVFCYNYRDGGMCLQNITGTLVGDVVIPDSVIYEGTQYPVTSIQAGFNDQTDMTSVTLPKGLTRVWSCFYNNTSLTRVDFNGTIEQWCNIIFNDWCSNPTYIAHHLFVGGTEVIDLVIPEGVTSINSRNFYGLNFMATVTLPSTLDTIGPDAFADCNGLRRTIFNGTIADWCRIGFNNYWSNPIVVSQNLYLGSSKVTNLVIPEGVTTIKPYAFRYLNSVSSIGLPEGLVRIGREAFWDCNWSVSYTIPSTVTTIEENAISSNATLYFNAVNCNNMYNNAMPYFNTIVVGEGVQTIPPYLITTDTWTLKMQGNPPSVTSYTFDRLREEAQVQVKCGFLSAYQSAAVWSDLPNLVESNTYALKFGAADHGRCEIWENATCSSQARVYAYNDDYYHFVRWSDGNTDNPRYVSLTQDTLLTPVFAIDTYYVVPVVCDNQNERGYVYGGDTVEARQLVTIEAHPNPGYYFTGWNDGDGQAVRVVDATWSREICAHFEQMQYVEGQLYYRLSPGHGMVVSGHNGDIEGHLVIPDTVEFEGIRYPVVGIDSWCLSQQYNMTAVTLPATLDTIRSEAFYIEDNLTAVYYTGTLAQWCHIYFESEWSNPVRSGNSHRLYIGGEEVTNLVIPEGVTSIGQYAFVNCNNIANVTLPSTLDSVGYGAFRDCWALVRTRFMGSIAQWCNIGFGAENSNPIHQTRNLYLGSNKVSDLVIPAGVTAIKPYAFYNCSSIASVAMADGVLAIGESAFQGCESMTSVDFSPNVTTIGMNAFRYCHEVRLFQLPDSLRTIESWAFWDCWNAKVVIPPAVTSMSWEVVAVREVEYNAVNCTDMGTRAIAMGTITVGEAVQVLPYNLIHTDLYTLRMLGEPPVVENFALDRLRSDATVQVKCGLLPLYQANDEWNEKNIEETNVYSLTFGQAEHGNVDVYEWATCTAPARVYAWPYEGWHFMGWSDGVTDNPRTIALTQDTVVTPLFVGDLYDTLADGVVFRYYYNGMGLTLAGVNGSLSGAVVIPDSVLFEGGMMPVTAIGGAAFAYQYGMTTLSFPAGVTQVGNDAFYECNGLVRTFYGGTVAQWCAIDFDGWCATPTQYGHYLNIAGTDIINLVIPEGVTAIGRNAFRGLNTITRLTLPASLDTIGQDAFEGCDALSRVNYTGTLADWCGIGFCVDWGCNPLETAHCLYINGNKVTDLVIPEGVTSVKPYAFHYLDVNSVEFPEGLTSIGSWAFEGWIPSITIPSSVVSVGERALSGNVLYYNAINCTSMANGAISGANAIVVGESVQVLPSNLINNNLWTLRMQGEPPVVDFYAFDIMPEGSQVQVPCGLLATYQNTPVWDSANLVETNTYTFKLGAAEHGSAWFQSEASCTMPAQVYAGGESYYHFVQWNDGNTDNPRTVALTQDTMLIPEFAIDTYTVDVALYAPLQGTVEGGGRVLAFDSVTIAAHANLGYRFIRWDDWDEHWEDSVRTVAAYSDRTYYPLFEPVQMCDSTSYPGITMCYQYNGHGMTLQNITGTITGIFVIPDSVVYEGMMLPVTAIHDGSTFGGQNGMTWITLPKGLTRVGCDAFWGCDNLTRVNWNGTIEQWCQIDFDCWWSNPIQIARHLFMDGREVVNLVIPEGVSVVKQYAFSHLSSLASVTLPSTLDSIAGGAFDDCNGLQRTYYNGTVAQWCHIGFADNWSSRPVSYSGNLYVGGELLTNLVVPEGITAIKPYAFRNLGCLRSIELPEGLLTIGREAFWDCNWGLSVTIPSTVTRIEEYAILSSATLYFNAINCTFVANNALPYYSKVYVDDAVQSLPIYLITGSINQLIMQGMPPAVTGDVLDRLRDDAQIYVPCGLLATYQNTPVWDSANLVENNTYALKFGPMAHGYGEIWSEATCTDSAYVYASADWKWHFTQWTDGVTDNPRYITLTQDTVLTPVFAIDTYYVIGYVSPMQEYGVVLGNDTVLADDTVTLTALANYGYHFVQWDDGDTNAVRTIVAEYNWWMNAQFEKNQYNVGLAVSDSTPFGYVYGEGTYYYLDNVYAYASANNGYHLVSWSDGVTDNPRYISLTHDTALTVEFAIDTYTVAAQPNAAERGVAMVSDSTALYLDSVTISATANYGYYFMQWNDGNTENPRQVQVTSNVVYTAQFGFVQFSVSLAVDTATHGSVSGAGSYNYLSSRTVTATPAYGYHFTQWTDGVTDNPRTFTLTQDTSFTAEFAKNSYTITALSGNSVMGDAQVSESSVEYLDSVVLTATANYGYHFTQWNDGNTDNPRQVQVTANTTYTAQFTFNQYSVTLAVDDAVHGTVSGASDYNYLTSVTITATPAYGYHFTQWNDGNTDNPRTFSLTQDTAFTAEFANNTYTVSLSVNDESMGTVTGAGNYAYLDTAVLTATCTAEHHHFVQWTDGVTESTRSVVVTCDSAFSAIFAIDTHMLVTVTRLGTAEGVTNNEDCGTIVGAGLYPYGSVVTLQASASDNYHFAEWDNAERTLDRVVTVTQDTIIAGIFTDDVVPSIYMVSVQGARNVVIWTQELEVESYNIYREGNTSGQYELVATIPFYESPMWVDTASRPTTRSYRYKMTATDIYGYESDFSTVHKTMHLTISQGIGTSWNLVWTEYKGTDYSTYVIYRGTEAGNIQQIDIMPSGDNTTYTDENAPEGVVYYQVGIMLSESSTKAGGVILSNIATNGNVGIANVDWGDIKIYSRDGRIVIEGADGQTAVVYDVSGRRITDRRLTGGQTAEVSVSSGVYLVKIGDLPARRVVVAR